MMDGLKLMKKDKTALENNYSKIRYIFNHYEEQGKQQKEHAFQALKEDFTEKIRQAMQQQLGTSSMSSQIDVEKQPQFQQEWKRIQTQIDDQYINHLKELVHELIEMP